MDAIYLKATQKNRKYRGAEMSLQISLTIANASSMRIDELWY